MKFKVPVVQDINIVTDWLCINGLSNGDEIQADLMIVVGNPILSTIMSALDLARKSDVSILRSGGYSDSSTMLRYAIQNNPFTTILSPYIRSQLDSIMLYEIAVKLFHMHSNKIYIGDWAKNVNQKANYCRGFILQHSLDAKKVILVQDPLMKRSTFELFKHAWLKYRLECLFFNWPVFKPRISLIRTYPNRILFQTMMPQVKCSIAS